MFIHHHARGKILHRFHFPILASSKSGRQCNNGSILAMLWRLTDACKHCQAHRLDQQVDQVIGPIEQVSVALFEFSESYLIVRVNRFSGLFLLGNLGMSTKIRMDGGLVINGLAESAMKSMKNFFVVCQLQPKLWPRGGTCPR